MEGLRRREFLTGLAALLGTSCATQNQNAPTPQVVAPRRPLIPFLVAQSFEEYNPKGSLRVIPLEDKLFEDYISYPYTAVDLKARLGCKNYKVNFQPSDRLDVKNPVKFKEDVLGVAQTLGIRKVDIRHLSVKDTILLSGRIVAERLQYLDEINGDKIRAAQIQRVANLARDESFSEGFGQCADYAADAAAIFNVLRGINPKLANTRMRSFRPDTYTNLKQLPHGWNMVTTVGRSERGKRIIDLTYVDPTWLDTQNNYEGFNKEHFGDERITLATTVFPQFEGERRGAQVIYCYTHLASVYEALSSKERVGTPFAIHPELRREYQEIAFILRMYSCELFFEALQKCEEVGGTKEQAEKLKGLIFADNYIELVSSFLSGTENLIGAPIQQEGGLDALSSRENFAIWQNCYAKIAHHLPQLLGTKIAIHKPTHFNFVCATQSAQNDMSVQAPPLLISLEQIYGKVRRIYA